MVFLLGSPIHVVLSRGHQLYVGYCRVVYIVTAEPTYIKIFIKSLGNLYSSSWVQQKTVITSASVW